MPVRTVTNLLEPRNRFFKLNLADSGGGTNVTSEITNINGVRSASLTSAAVTSGRAYWGKTLTLNAGEWYAFSFEVLAESGNLSSFSGIGHAGGTATIDRGSIQVSGVEISANGIGRYASVFMSIAGGTAIIRAGVGLPTTVSNQSITFSNICLEMIDISQGYSPSEYVYPTYTSGFDYPVSTSRDPNTSFVSEPVRKKREIKGKYSSILCIGDSRTDDEGDIGDQLRILMPTAAIEWHARAAWTSTDMLAYEAVIGSNTYNFNIDKALSGKLLRKNFAVTDEERVYDVTETKFNTLLISTFGVNNLASVTDTPTGLAAVSAFMVDINIIVIKAVSLGMKIIISDNIPWGANANSSQIAATILMNFKLQEYAANNSHLFVSVYEPLGSAADHDVLDAAYDSGDGVHMNATGSILFAQAIKDSIDANGFDKSIVEPNSLIGNHGTGS